MIYVTINCGIISIHHHVKKCTHFGQVINIYIRNNKGPIIEPCGTLVVINFVTDCALSTTTDIPSTINIHNTELQMVKVHINNTKYITVANIYVPPRDTTSKHYKTADTDIQHCIQYITNIPHSFLTGYVKAHTTIWHSYTDDHRGQLIADVISNSDHITLNTNTPTRVTNTTLQQRSSPDITTVSNTLYNRTSWTTQYALPSDHLPIITTINIRHDY